MFSTVIEIWQRKGPRVHTFDSQEQAHIKYIVAETWLETESPNRLIAVFEYGENGDLIECRSRKGEL